MLETRRAYQETGNDHYQHAVDRAITWLWDAKQGQPYLPIRPGLGTRVYTARAAWIMEDYEAADYWLPCGEWDIRWGNQERPHYIAYMLEGLHHLGFDIRETLNATKHIDGLYPFYASQWNRVMGTDTSATIQMAILYKKCGMSIDHLLPAIQEMITPNGGLRHSADETRMTIWTAKYYLDLLRLL